MGRKPDKTVTLVLGGARSGKSRYAQQLASAFTSVTVIATARPSDGEMRRKIAAHRRERPHDWQTIEAPIQLDAAIGAVSPDAGALVIDCLTIHLANLMSTRKRGSQSGQRAAIMQDVEKICAAIESVPVSVIIVSNEVGSGIVPAFPSGRAFRDLLGSFNQRVAQIADRVVLMIAGLPLTIKSKEAKPC